MKTPEDKELSDERYYMGHAFRYADVAPFLARLAPGAELDIRRFELTHIYGSLTRRPA